MTSNPFNDFIQFIECDRALYQSEKLKNLLLAEIQALTDSIAAATQKVDEVKASVSALKFKVHSHETDIKTKRARATELAARLDRISNPKEYTATTKEIEELGRSEAAFEEELFEFWQTYEEAQASFDKQYEAYKAWVLGQQELIDDKKKNVARIELDLQRLAKERAEIESAVKPEFLQDYYQMKRSVPDPYVPVEGSHCSACRYEISLSDLAQTRKHVFVSCRDCFRKLYAL